MARNSRWFNSMMAHLLFTQFVIRLEMDALFYLGKSFTDLAPLLDSNGIIKLFDDEVADEWNEDFVQAKDGSWEFLLNTVGAITTIFLYPEKGCSLPFGILARMTPQQVHGLLGEPSKSGMERVSEFLDPKGAWNRWDYTSYCLHVEYSVGTNELTRVTFMLPESAP